MASREPQAEWGTAGLGAGPSGRAFVAQITQASHYSRAPIAAALPLGIIASACGGAPAEQPPARVIGVLNGCGSTSAGARASHEAFLAGLREYGYEDGRNVRLAATRVVK